MTRERPMLVVGVTAAGAAGLPGGVVDRILAADLLAGGRRHHGYFPDFAGERLTIGANVDEVVAALRRARAAGRRCVVVASGDPLFYGIGSALRRAFEPDELEFLPAPSAAQLAFAALGEPWQEAALLSAHGRPLAAVVAGVLTAEKAAILTDDVNTPSAIAKALLAAGLEAETRSAVCENLGGADERLVRLPLAEAAAQEFAPLNVFIVWNGTRGGRPWGVEDAAYATSAGQITKREVRLLALAELGLDEGEVLWDVGAGSGSVSLEAARARPSAQVFAVEKRPQMIAFMRQNLARFPAPNLRLAEGNAPEACAEWPDPDCVFVGGSGGRLTKILEMVRARLKGGGRLVVNLATVENLLTARQVLPEAMINQVQISRGVPILDMLRFEAQNPVFMVRWIKQD